MGGDGGGVVAVIGAFGTLAGFIFAAITIYLTMRSNARADRATVAQAQRDAVDAAVAAERALQDIRVGELKADLARVNRENSYLRARVDVLQDQLNGRKQA